MLKIVVFNIMIEQKNELSKVKIDSITRDLQDFSTNQKKAYNACLKSFKGLKHKEAQKVLYTLLDAISQNATLE